MQRTSTLRSLRSGGLLPLIARSVRRPINNLVSPRFSRAVFWVMVLLSRLAIGAACFLVPHLATGQEDLFATAAKEAGRQTERGEAVSLVDEGGYRVSAELVRIREHNGDWDYFVVFTPSASGVVSHWDTDQVEGLAVRADDGAVAVADDCGGRFQGDGLGWKRASVCAIGESLAESMQRAIAVELQIRTQRYRFGVREIRGHELRRFADFDFESVPSGQVRAGAVLTEAWPRYADEPESLLVEEEARISSVCPGATTERQSERTESPSRWWIGSSAIGQLENNQFVGSTGA